VRQPQPDRHIERLRNIPFNRDSSLCSERRICLDCVFDYDNEHLLCSFEKPFLGCYLVPNSIIMQTSFAPMLAIPNGTTDIDFYKKAFGAVEHWCLRNDDDSVHVAEFDINGAIFHLHEVTPHSNSTTIQQAGGGTVTIGLFTDDVHAVFDCAVAAGAKVINPVTDFDYGYRQGDLQDAFGHRWTIQKKIADVL